MDLTGKEVKIPNKRRLISTTDLKGIITYANDDFVKISGFSREELIGSPHNLVRHPAMPKVAFADLWRSVQQNDSWRGIVLNRCKSGDYYWVDAYVTPIYRRGEKIGYQSVRVAPQQVMVEKAKALYQRVHQAGKSAKPPAYRSAMLWPLVLFVLQFLVMAAGLAHAQAWAALVGGLLLQAGFAASVWFKVLQPSTRLRQQAKAVASNPITQKVYADAMDEWGEVQFALQMERARMRTVLGRMDDFSAEIARVVEQVGAAAGQMRKGTEQQDQEVDMVAVAINELSATAVDISKSMVATSDAVQVARKQAQTGENHLSDMTGAVRQVSQQVKLAADEAALLEKRTAEIEQVIKVITDIAEQTNLLALNAAIEAARAGEYGRGFAVVADEVRTLATRTKESTASVRETVDNIVSAMKEVVTSLSSSQAEVDKSGEISASVHQAFQALSHTIEDIAQQSLSVASAAEEQTAVVDEIQQNVESIRHQSSVNTQISEQNERSTQDLREMQQQLSSMVKAFEQQ